MGEILINLGEKLPPKSIHLKDSLSIGSYFNQLSGTYGYAVQMLGDKTSLTILNNFLEYLRCGQVKGVKSTRETYVDIDGYGKINTFDKSEYALPPLKDPYDIFLSNIFLGITLISLYDIKHNYLPRSLVNNPD
jgi:hypothetical protein